MKFILVLSILAGLAIYVTSQPYPFGMPQFPTYPTPQIVQQQVIDPRVLVILVQMLQTLQGINNDLQKLLGTAALGANNNQNGIDPAMLAILAAAMAGNNGNSNDRSPSVVKIPSSSYGGGGGYSPYGRVNEQSQE